METINASEYLGNLFYALAIQGVKSISYDEKLHMRMSASFSAFKSLARAKGVRPDFSIDLDPLTKHAGQLCKHTHTLQSPLITGLNSCIKRGLVSFGAPTAETLVLNITPLHAQEGLKHAIGGAKVYDKAAKVFLAFH